MTIRFDVEAKRRAAAFDVGGRDTAAGNAANAAMAAQTAQTAAESAQQAAEAAKTGAEDAKTAAESAQEAAQTAATAAQTAQTAAEDAQQAAETAKTSAESAKTAAEMAQEAAGASASAAAGSAAAAQEKAAEAAQSASAAAEDAAKLANQPINQITGATIGQIAKITAVDDAGKPTAWEPVDMPSGGETWEKIEEIDFATDVANDVHTWTFSDLPGYKALLFKRVNMTGSTATVSGLTCKINDISNTNIPQAIAYQKQGQVGSGFTFFVVTPEGILCVASGMATNPTNYTQGSLNTTYNLFPPVVRQITKFKLQDNALYPIASGELIIYGLRSVVITQEEAT